MIRKDAKIHPQPSRKWKARVCLLGGALIILTTCVVVRYNWKTVPANAQVPGKTVAASSATLQDSSEADRKTSDKSNVVAVVNGAAISRQELAAECLKKTGNEVLDQLVNKYIILDACKQQGIVISQQDVADEISITAQKFKIPVNGLLEMLEQERGINPEQYRNDIIWPTLALRRLSAQKISITEEELRTAFESQYGPKVKVRMISVTRRQEAERLHALLVQDPTQFANLAMDHSEDQNSKPYGGAIPPIRRHAGLPEIEAEAFRLKEREISEIVHVANQYVILKCEAHLPKTSIPPEYKEAATKGLEDRLRTQKTRTAATENFQQLMDAAKTTVVFTDPQLQAKMPGIAATVNSHQITTRQLAEECILRHGTAILDRMIDQQLIQREIARRQMVVSQRDIDQEIMRAAHSYNFVKNDGTTDVEDWLQTITEEEEMTREQYVQEIVWPTIALKRLVADQVTITEEDLEKGFASNYGERVECLAIVLTDQRRAQMVWNKASKTSTDDYFSQLATQYSGEPVSRHNGGRIPPIRQYGGQPLVEEQAFSLEKGQMSGIIATGDKYIILRCLGRTDPIVKVSDIDSVRDDLYRDIQEKKFRLAMAKEFDQIKGSAQIDNFLAGTTQSGSRQYPAAGSSEDSNSLTPLRERQLPVAGQLGAKRTKTR